MEVIIVLLEQTRLQSGGDYNTLIGFQAGYNSSSLRSGDNNTFIGTQSGYNNGINNLYIGHKAGYNRGSETNTLRIANQYATLIKGGFPLGFISWKR